MSLSEKEVREILATTIGKIRAEADWNSGQIASEFLDLFEHYDLAEELYNPSNSLVARIEDYQRWRDGQQEENAGELMEEIALLALISLKGWDAVGSYRSYAHQLDVTISGSKPHWFLLMEYLHLPREKRTLVIEAKNIDEKVSDAQFSRLCGIIQNNLGGTCDIGIFFTREGASGFPTKKSKQQSLKEARATQILFYAKTGKYVIVLDQNDIRQLSRKGALPRILEARIRDVGEAKGVSFEYTDNWDPEILLPSHLAKHMNNVEKDGDNR